MIRHLQRISLIRHLPHITKHESIDDEALLHMRSMYILYAPYFLWAITGSIAIITMLHGPHQDAGIFTVSIITAYVVILFRTHAMVDSRTMAAFVVSCSVSYSLTIIATNSTDYTHGTILLGIACIIHAILTMNMAAIIYQYSEDILGVYRRTLSHHEKIHIIHRVPSSRRWLYTSPPG